MIIIWLYISYCEQKRAGYFFGELKLSVFPATANTWELKEQKRTILGRGLGSRENPCSAYMTSVAGIWFAWGEILWKAGGLGCVFCHATCLLKDIHFLACPVPHMVILGSSWFLSFNDNFPVIEPELLRTFFLIPQWQLHVVHFVTLYTSFHLHVLFLIAPASSLFFTQLFALQDSITRRADKIKNL